MEKSNNRNSNKEYFELKRNNNIDNILNIKDNEKSDEYIKLMKFVKGYEINKQDESYKEKMNICDLYTKKTYAIDNQNIKVFMNLLEQCRLKRLKLNFTELQNSNMERNIGSGIMFDFDILMKTEESILPLINYNTLVLKLMEVIKNVVDLRLTPVINEDYDMIEDEPESLIQYIAVIRKEKPLYKEELNMYKDGIHILIPGIKITKEVKKYIMKQILLNNEIQSIFKTNNLNLELKDILDTNSTSVPVHFFGNCKTNSIPYILDNVYRVSISRDSITTPVNVTNIFNENNINLCYDFSLNFINKNGNILSKRFYKPHKSLYEEIKLYNEHYKLNDFDDELDEINNDISLKGGYIPDTNYIKGLLRCLSVERLNDRNKWRNVIYAIANTSKEFKSLAKWVSKRNPEKWDLNTFENLWTEATMVNVTSTNKLSFRSLIYWAKEDNLEQYNLINDESIKTLINNDIHNRILVGDLQQFQYAKYLFHMFKDKFVTDYQNKDISWYEFVLPTDSYTQGQIYKWRMEESRPDNLLNYLSKNLINIFNDIINEMDFRVANEEDPEIVKYLSLVKKKLISSVKHLFSNSYKMGIIKEAETLFRRRGFIESLNSDKDIMGVGNGVLKLSDNPELIETLHSYPISHFTTVNYVPYNPNCPYVIQITNTIKSLFPENEMDAYEYMLYYLASCLDGKPKQSIIFIIIGSGCHAIDTPILMYDGSIKKVQDVKLSDQIMGDDNTPRIVKKLYRGNEQMVKITPLNQESFSVNINHILSLVFSNLTKIITNENDYKLIWYEYNNKNEPIKHSSIFKNKMDIENYKLDLYKNNNVIKEYDIIDIKVSDLLKWDNLWLSKGYIKLYKATKLNYKEQKLDIEPYMVGQYLGKNKYIPFNYKTSSINQRLELLGGILDSYGKYNINLNQYEIELENELMNDIIYIVNSLGLKNIKNAITNKIIIYGNDINIIPTKILKSKYVSKTNNQTLNTYEFTIELLNNDDFYGFELDKNHRYVTGDYFVHHNSNGKSFYLEFVNAILGTNYGTKMPLTFLTDKRTKSSAADPSFMNLENARLAHYSEANPDDQLNTAKVKEITGQETLSGRNLFEKQRSFIPACMHLVTTNYHFGVKTTDHGTWRRIRTYKFKNVFNTKPDPKNKYEKLADEKVSSYIYDDNIKQAFLSILVEYYKVLQTKYKGNLLNIPCETIEKETNDYRNDEDEINKFIDDRCIYSPGSQTLMIVTVDIYRSWYSHCIDSETPHKITRIPHLLKNSKIGSYYKTRVNGIYLEDLRFSENPEAEIKEHEKYYRIYEQELREKKTL